MGFVLWIKDDLAWAQGTSEYRAHGVAVISATDLFQQRDFKPRRPLPPGDPLAFAGMFASIGDLNLQLLRRRRGVTAPNGSRLEWRRNTRGRRS